MKQRFINFLVRIGLIPKLCIKFDFQEVNLKALFGEEVITEAFENYVANFILDLVNNKKFESIDIMSLFLGQYKTEKELFRSGPKDSEKKPIEEKMKELEWSIIQV